MNLDVIVSSSGYLNYNCLSGSSLLIRVPDTSSDSLLLTKDQKKAESITEAFLLLS